MRTNNKNIFQNLYSKNYFFYIFVILILLSFAITFIILLPDNELVRDKSDILLLLSLDTILVIILIGLIIRQIVFIIINRRKNYLSSKLYIKFVNLFTLIALAPTIGVIIITALFFNLELRTWYGEAVKSTIINSNAIATDYLKQKQENLEIDIETISREIFNFGVTKKLTKNDLDKIIRENLNIRKLEDIYLFNASNKIISFSSIANSTDNFQKPNNVILKNLNNGLIHTMQKNDNVISAYYKLRYLKDTYLLINDNIDRKIYDHLFETAKAISAYNASEEDSLGLQISFSMIFVLFSVCILFLSILLGFRIAGNLSQPISNLIKSSEKVATGNFDAKVIESNDSDEISVLLKSFNKMITEIENQQNQLIEKNIEIENRRLFTEAVLASLSTGVIALDNNFKITLINKSITSIIDKSDKVIMGMEFFKLFPELNIIKSSISKKLFNNLTQQIEYDVKGSIRNLFVKIAVEIKNDLVIGYVATIDDLTSLILAEKHAAWSDIARKIAHEIKNPLTPIKLSAERIDKKIKEKNYDHNTFSTLAKTISKQVDDIGKLIDEFSSFARLPKAEKKNDDFCLVLKECFDFYFNAYTNINFKLENDNDSIICYFDKFQISLVLNNIIKNAVEAVSKIKNASISFKLTKDEHSLSLNIIDNGIGINKELMNKIFKPYFTTKEKGTGLGLSICKKIIEDHNGKIFIKKNSSAGSTVSVSLLL